MAQRPGLGLPTVCVAMIPKRLSTVEGAGISWTVRNSGRATCKSKKKVSGPTFFPEPSRPFGCSHVNMNHRGGGVANPFAHPTTSSMRCQAPRVRGLLQCAGAKGDALVVAQGAIGRVGDGPGNLGKGK